MKCPHCGEAEIPDGGVCPRCGKSAGAPPATLDRPRRPYVLAGVLAAILILGIVVLLVTPRGSVIEAPAPQPPAPGPPVTAAPAPQVPEPGPPVTGAPAPQPPSVTPPAPDPNKAAVEAYIQKVGLIEKQRQQIVLNLGPALIQKSILEAGASNPLLGPLSDLLEGDPDAAREARASAGAQSQGQVQGLIDGYLNQLRALDQQFRAIQPVPQPAYTFARSYAEALVQYAGSIVQISQALSAGVADPSQAQAQAAKLSAMKGGLQLQAEQGLQRADAQLTALVQHFGIQKPYDITDTPRSSVAGGG